MFDGNRHETSRSAPAKFPDMGHDCKHRNGAVRVRACPHSNWPDLILGEWPISASTTRGPCFKAGWHHDAPSRALRLLAHLLWAHRGWVALLRFGSELCVPSHAVGFLPVPQGTALRELIRQCRCQPRQWCIGNQKQVSDMEREYQIEATEMTDEQLDAVNGGGGVIAGLGVRTDQRIALQQQLTAAYARNNPIAYYGYFG
jgi:hypothetical protein